MIDLHVHSTASDGTLSPSELIQLAKSKNLEAIALTDHDTVSGLEEFHKTGKELGVETISGIELSASWYHSSVHILGLFIDENCAELKEFLERASTRRLQRNEKIIKKISALGFDVTLDEWSAEAGHNVPGRPHLASLLVKRGHFPDIKTVFDELIGNHSPGFERQHLPHPQEAIALIHKAGGLAIWAHPYAMRSVPFSTLKKTGLTLKGYGLDGVETFYSHFSEEGHNNAVRFAERYNLLQSGGSDFHGENSAGIDLGTGKGDFSVPYELLANLKNCLNHAD